MRTWKEPIRLTGAHARTALAGLGLLVLVLSSACTKTEPQPPPVASVAAPVKAVPAPQPAPRPSAWNYAAPPAPPAGPDAAPVTATITADKGPDRDELTRAVGKVMKPLAACFQGTTATSVSLNFEADPSGRANNVHVHGASAAAESCVSATLAKADLPTFAGVPVRIDVPLSITTRTVEPERQVVPIPTGVDTTMAAPAIQPEPAPAAFVQP